MKSINKNLKLMQSTTEEIFKITTEATIQGAEVVTHLPEEASGDLKAITIKQHHQTIKADKHTGETVVTKTKVTEEAKLKTKVKIMTKTIANIAINQATLWRNAGSSKLKRHQCM